MPDLFASISEIPEVDPSKDYFSELVGEGKKFQTPQELALGKAHSDAHIARLEAEQEALREELKTRLNEQSFEDRLKATIAQLSKQDEQRHEEPLQDKTAMKPEDVERLLEMKMQQMRSQSVAEQNSNTVSVKLREVYGPNYAQKLREQATALDMTEQDIRNLAARNPKLLYRLLGIDEEKRPQGFDAPPRTQQTTLPHTGTKRGWAYFEDIRKNKPDEYFSHKVQNEMFARRKELGEEAFHNS